MPAEFIGIGCFLLVIISVISFISIGAQDTGGVGFFFGCLCACLVVFGLYRIDRQNNKRVETLVTTVPVIIVEESAFIKDGASMINMNAQFNQNISPETKIDITEWTEQVGWIYFGKDRSYKIHVPEKSN